LEAVKAALVTAGGPPGTTWAVDIRANTVVVTLPRSAGDARAEALVAATRRFGSRVRMHRAEGPARPSIMLRGGQDITGVNGAACSVGFNVRRANDRRFFLTAGHCTILEANWNRLGNTLGPTVQSDHPLNDYGMVRILDPAFWKPKGEILDFGTPVAVTAFGQAPVGATVCKTGRTTGTTCGAILNHNLAILYQAPPPLGGLVLDLTEVNACNRPGDSGGPVYQPTAQFGPVAQGLTSGTIVDNAGNCLPGALARTYVQPVGEALAAYNVQLLQP
jgi:hypothetical protein